MTKKQAKKVAKKTRSPRKLKAAFPMGMHVVVVGDFAEGFAFYGPFKTGADAADWAGRNVIFTEWFAVPVYNKENFAR